MIPPLIFISRPWPIYNTATNWNPRHNKNIQDRNFKLFINSLSSRDDTGRVEEFIGQYIETKTPDEKCYPENMISLGKSPRRNFLVNQTSQFILMDLIETKMHLRTILRVILPLHCKETITNMKINGEIPSPRCDRVFLLLPRSTE